MEEMNNTPRLLITFIMDNSASVSTERLKALMGGFRAFAVGEEIPCRVEWELLTFDAFSPVAVKSFADDQIAPVSAGRFPLLGRSILVAADRLTARVKALQDEGETVFRPWMFLLSGGFTADRMEASAALLDRMEKEGDLLYLPFKLGTKLETERLQCLDRNKHMIEIKEGQMNGFFEFVTRMIARRAELPPETGIKFAKTDFEGWAVL